MRVQSIAGRQAVRGRTPAAPCHGQPRTQLPRCQAAAQAAPVETEDSLGEVIEQAFCSIFTGTLEAPRVLASFRRLRAGEEFEHEWPGLGVQKANSYIQGLTAHPWPDPYGGQYDWLVEVEKNAAMIQQEFERVTADPARLESRGNAVWVPAAREDAVAYGPDWRTLVLQDRGVWEKSNSKLFPQTCNLFKSLDAPTQEVFFARQTGGTGIASHTDYCNFIQTSHLGLRVPEGDCWMKAGLFTKKWEEGRVIVCDTSFMHETWNGTSEDRYVLIMRHWHPEVSKLEQIAAQFLFECVDGTGRGTARKLAAKRLKAAGLAK